MKWVLIFAIYLTGDRGGVALDHVEFESKATCEAAGRAMAAEWSRGAVSFRDQSRWVCVRQNENATSPKQD